MSGDTKPGELYWSYVDPIWDRVSIYDGPEVFLEQIRKVSEVQRQLFAAHWCSSEVRNGGLQQFFSNATGVLAPEALEAFRVIGLPQCADALEKAMAFFGEPYPRERATRESMLDDAFDPFTEFDDVFFEAFRDHGFDRAADAYAARWSA